MTKRFRPGASSSAARFAPPAPNFILRANVNLEYLTKLIGPERIKVEPINEQKGSDQSTPRSPHLIRELDLKESHALRQAALLNGQGVETTVDAAFVSKAQEAITEKVNEVVRELNEDNRDLQEVQAKINEIIRSLKLLETHYANLAQSLSGVTEDPDKISEL